MAAKAKTAPYTLIRGRSEPFYRTLVYKAKDAKTGKIAPDPKRDPVRMVFEPNVDVDLTEEEVDLLSVEIAAGMIIPSNRDSKGRVCRPREQNDPSADEAIAKLEARVESIAAENAELKAANEKLTAELAEFNELIDDDDEVDADSE